MRLLFVADGRSPTARNWLRHWLETGHEAHLVSTFPCDPPPGLASFHVLPVAFNRMAGGGGTGSPRRTLISRLRGLLRPVRYILGPLSLPRYRRQFRRLAAEIAPDLVHALRIPFEGMLAEAAPEGIPLVVSIWGNDITLHARGSFLMAKWTRRTLRRAQGLMADTARDIRLGREWGFDGPTLVVPGAGGIRLDEFSAAGERRRPEPVEGSAPLPEGLPDAPLVVNPRGQRPGSLRQDIFFRSIPLVLEKVPQAVFVCPPLAGDAEAERWVEALGIRSSTRLWPLLTQPQLWALYRKAQVFVSPSVHDGTPNSLLEAMACGCFPVAGNIESMREWITPGVNGLLADAADPQALAAAIVSALENKDLRRRAAGRNAELIAERADYARCMAKAEEFYESVKRKT
ncbi:MAG: putative glycosyltransferase [Anaerolineaceae bacterium]|nr:MAG: putative glycosyltransferase [Anaerolineaceae bacterium]